MAARRAPKQVRGERFVEKVFESTAAEVARVGHQHVSIEEIAAHAGVNKTSIYRRWGTPEQLVLEMFDHGSDERYSPPDTGTLRGDLIECLLRFEQLQQVPNALAIVRMYVSSAFTGKVRVLMEQLAARDRQEVIMLFERGIARGELPKGANAEIGYDLLHGLKLIVVPGLDRREQRTAKSLAPTVETIILGLANMAMRQQHEAPPRSPRRRKAG